MKISIFLSNYFANDVWFFDVFRRRMNLRFLNMSNVHDDALIAQLTHIHEYSFKKNQLKTIKCFRDEQNVILFAKTNYEKSMILYSLFALKFDIIILLIFFLNALKMNQCKIIQKLNANVKSCILNDDIIIKTLLNEIKMKTYIHILTSLKLALFNVSFRKILQTFDFCDRICLVVIDEIHLMKNWFNERIKYDRFYELRNILFRIIFLFIISIILEDELIAKLIKKLKFNENVKFIHESMNRKKNILQRSEYSRCFHRQFRRFSLFDRECQSIIEKIILYEEKIQTFIDVKQTLIKFYVKIRNNVDQIEKKIKCYNKKRVRIKRHLFDYRDTSLRIQKHSSSIRETFYPFFF
jgi:superfamily II DNA helicase RecQ